MYLLPIFVRNAIGVRLRVVGSPLDRARDPTESI
jgi:hypothetical protein